MHIISFATEESNWRKPRLGILLHQGDRDNGYRLDCERLFDPADQPANPLAWFDMDGKWLQGSRAIAEALARDEKALADAKERGRCFYSRVTRWKF